MGIVSPLYVDPGSDPDPVAIYQVWGLWEGDFTFLSLSALIYKNDGKRETYPLGVVRIKE